MTMRFSAASHLGHKRKNNEDNYFAQQQEDGSLLLAVADGMGGEPGGAEASAFAIAAFSAVDAKTSLSPPQLTRLAMDGHKAILEHVKENADMKGMGTTLTAALIQGDQFSWVHIGDSRLYRLHNGELRQITRDHRLLWNLVKDRKPDPEELRHHPLWNMLDQCLGGQDIELEIGNDRFLPGDCLLLCTDGLHDELALKTIALLLTQEASPAEKAESLVKAALDAGGRDNVTVIVAE